MFGEYVLTKRGNFSDLQCELEESPVQTGLVWSISSRTFSGFAQSLMVKNVQEVDQRVTVSLQTLRDSWSGKNFGAVHAPEKIGMFS